MSICIQTDSLHLIRRIARQNSTFLHQAPLTPRPPMTPHSPTTPHPPITPRSPMTPHSPMKSCLSMAPTSLTAPSSTSPSRPVESPTDLKFRFESSSSHGSTSNETDESEANCPRYSYSVSPSPQDVSDTVVVFVTDVCTLRCHCTRQEHIRTGGLSKIVLLQNY